MSVTSYPTHPCLYNGGNCTNSGDDVQNTTYAKPIDDIKNKLLDLGTTSQGSLAYSYALADYSNAITQLRASRGNIVDDLAISQGTTTSAINAQYESAMIAGVMWATLGTVILYFTFTGLSK